MVLFVGLPVPFPTHMGVVAMHALRSLSIFSRGNGLLYLHRQPDCFSLSMVVVLLVRNRSPTVTFVELSKIFHVCDSWYLCLVKASADLPDLLYIYGLNF